MDTLHWTIEDVDLLPDDGSRYEIIDGELYVSKQPEMEHQIVCTRIASLLNVWSNQTELGWTIGEPGVIFTRENAVVPDVVWISDERYRFALDSDKKFHASPELMIEVLSPGVENRRRDRELKLRLYSRYGAQEYWVVNWQERQLEVYRRENAMLRLDRTLGETDVLESPLLPGFSCQVSQLFKKL